MSHIIALWTVVIPGPVNLSVPNYGLKYNSFHLHLRDVKQTLGITSVLQMSCDTVRVSHCLPFMLGHSVNTPWWLSHELFNYMQFICRNYDGNGGMCVVLYWKIRATRLTNRTRGPFCQQIGHKVHFHILGNVCNACNVVDI